MLTRAGIRNEVKTLPFAVFQARSIAGSPNGEPEFSFGMFGIGSSTGNSLQPMKNVVGTYDKRHNSGTNNRGRYTNKDLDALIAKASRTMDPKAREELQRAAAADHHSRLRRREGRPMRTMHDILRAMVAAYEIQGLLAPENRFIPRLALIMSSASNWLQQPCRRHCSVAVKIRSRACFVTRHR
jgi:hypothetical protein